MRTWLAGLEDEARTVLSAEVFGYYAQGAGEGTTTDEAVRAWERYRFLPRLLADVRRVDLETSFLGRAAPSPFGVAPTTLQRAADPDGEVAMARACSATGSPLVVSSNATARFAEIGETSVDWWLQVYLPQDRQLARPMLEQAVDAGARALVLTLDTPVVATKYDDGAIWSATPPEWVRVNLGAAADAPKARDLGPADIRWLREVTGLPVVTKGVLAADAAAAVVVAGASAVWVSNHGGRQLDRAASTADCLPRVVDRIDGAVPVYVDGGVRTGISALAALGLGATGVFLGRLPLYALAVDGTAGVERMLNELRDELTEALMLAGCRLPGEMIGRIEGFEELQRCGSPRSRAAVSDVPDA